MEIDRPHPCAMKLCMNGAWDYRVRDEWAFRLGGFALEGGLPAGCGGLAVEAGRAVGFDCFGLRAGRGVGELFTQGLELLFFRAEAGFARGKGLRRGVGHEGILLRMGIQVSRCGGQ